MLTGQRAVVIGSGMGGLTSAVLLASNGCQVTVLEQHYRPGGLLHRFFREGVPYDTGFHYCGSVQDGQIMNACLKHLGVWDELTFRPLDPDGFDRIILPELEFRVPVGRERYRERLKEHFPEDSKGIDAFVDAVADACAHYGLYSFTTTPHVEKVLHYESMTLDAFLDRHIRNPQCRAVIAGQSLLYGVPPADAPLGLHALVLDHFLQGAYSIDGGGDRLAMALVRRIRGLGGKVLLKTAAKAIEVEDRQVRGVHTEEGEFLPADLVVSNVHPQLTLKLLPPEVFRRAARRRIEGYKVGHAHLGVYLQLDRPVHEIGNTNIYRHQSWDVNNAYEPVSPENPEFYFATAPGNRHPGGKNIVLMILSHQWEQVAQWARLQDGERHPDYLAFKEQVRDSAVRALTEDHPSLKPHIIRAEASTPLTTQHYTRSPKGAMYGHYHSVDQMGRYRPAQATKVKNLLLVGQGVFMPGVLGTCLSAYYACGYLLGLDRLLEELKAS